MQLAAYLESKYLGQTVLDDLHITPIHAVKAILVVLLQVLLFPSGYIVALRSLL